MPEVLNDADNAAIGDLASFFARAQICIDAGLCAQDVLCSFLHEEAQSFRENLRGVLHRRLVKMDDVSPTYARKFSTETCNRQFKQYCVEVPRSPDCTPARKS